MGNIIVGKKGKKTIKISVQQNNNNNGNDDRANGNSGLSDVEAQKSMLPTDGYLVRYKICYGVYCINGNTIHAHLTLLNI